MYEKNTVIVEKSESGLSRVLAGVYGWMTVALGISAVCAYVVGSAPNLRNIILGNMWMLIGLVIIEVGLVMIISGMINKLAASTATALFALYAAVNGLTLSVVFVTYTLPSITSTFLITAGMFAAMAAVGTVIRKDLSGFGSFLLMALIGLIIASVVNIFWHNGPRYWIVTYAGVLIFSGLTVYDAQNVKKMYLMSDGSDETSRKIAVIGALTLYLDFVNLMLYLLRIFGNRKN